MTTTAAFCPTCGTDIEVDEPVAVGALRIDPRTHRVVWRGRPVHLPRAQFVILHTLVKARGALVGRGVLRERVGTEADTDCIDVWLTRIRHSLPGAPITSERGIGWRWAA